MSAATGVTRATTQRSAIDKSVAVLVMLHLLGRSSERCATPKMRRRMLLSTVCANELAYMRAANYRKSDGFVAAISGVERSIDAGLDIRFPPRGLGCESSCSYHCENSGRVTGFTLGPKLPTSFSPPCTCVHRFPKNSSYAKSVTSSPRTPENACWYSVCP